MRIGIDFDNTIVDYEDAFYAAAIERGLIDPDFPKSKNAVRDFLNESGRRDEFTALQGYVYGTRMALARPYPGFREFLSTARAADNDVYIVSHKSRFPLVGPKHDLHVAGRSFLQICKLSGEDAVPEHRIYFEETKELKVSRAAALELDIFIDDLPEILMMRGLPDRCRRILFAPLPLETVSGLEQCCSWDAISDLLFGARE